MGAKGLGCNMCMGNPLRGDSALRAVYDSARLQQDGFSKLADDSPCAAAKLYLLTRDARLGEAIVRAYLGSTDTMAPCANRQTLTDALVGMPTTTRDDNGLPRLCEIAMVVERLMEEQRDDPKEYLFKSPEEVFGSEDPRFGLLANQADSASHLVPEN